MCYSVVNRLTGQIITHQNSPVESCDYDPTYWLIDPELPDGVLPEHFKVVGDEVVEMTDDEKNAITNPPESMADRHAREQREGVTLTNGWQMAYTREARDVMGDLKNLIDLAGPRLPGVSFWEVDRTKHDATVADAVAIMTDYAVRSATEVMRQYAEVTNA